MLIREVTESRRQRGKRRGRGRRSWARRWRRTAARSGRRRGRSPRSRRACVPRPDPTKITGRARSQP